MPRTVDPQPHRAAPQGSSCDLDDAVLSRFVAGELDAPFSAAVVEHIKRCAPCGTRVTALRIAARRSAVRERIAAAKASQAATPREPVPDAPAPEPSATIDRPRRFTFAPEGVDLRLERGVGFPTPVMPVAAPITAEPPAPPAAPAAPATPRRADPPPVRIAEPAAPTEDDRPSEPALAVPKSEAGAARVEPERRPSRTPDAPAARPRMSRRRRLALATAPLLAAGATAGGLFAGGLTTGAAHATTHRPAQVGTVSPVADPPLTTSPASASAG